MSGFLLKFGAIFSVILISISVGLSVGLNNSIKGNPNSTESDMKNLYYAISFSLASIVDVLSGVLTGMNFGKDISRMYADPIQQKRKLGQFYIVIKPDIFLNKNIFLKRMQLMTNQIRKEPSIKNKKVLCPNDPEIINEKKRTKYGIPLEKNLYKKILNLSERFNLKLKTIN